MIRLALGAKGSGLMTPVQCGIEDALVVAAGASAHVLVVGHGPARGSRREERGERGHGHDDQREGAMVAHKEQIRHSWRKTLLRAKGAEVSYHDPFVPEVTFDHAYTIGDGEPLYNQELTDDMIAASDCVVICTEHSTVDYNRVCSLSKIIVDTRNALSEETRTCANAKIVRL